MTDTPMIDAAALWFSRWLGASSVRERDREYARDVVRTILAAAGRTEPSKPTAPPPQPTGFITIDTEPAPYLPGTIKGLAVYLQRMEMRVHHQLRRVENRIGRLEDRVDEMRLEDEYDPADAEPDNVPGCYRCQLGDPHTVHETAAEVYGTADGPAVCAGCGHQPPEGLIHTPSSPQWQCKDAALCQFRRAGQARPVAGITETREQVIAEAREQVLAELTGGKRPCPWCTGAPVFDSAEDMLTHARRHHLNAPYPDDEMVWLGDLSGFWVEPNDQHVILRHRCGWTVNVGIGYLGNMIADLVSAHRDAGCNPHREG